MLDDPRQIQTTYTLGEVAAMLAPLVDWSPEDVGGFVVVPIGKDGTVTFAASDNVVPEIVPALFRRLAAVFEADHGSSRGGSVPG